MRVFLDANILFSASRGPGGIRSLLEMAEVAGHALVADAYVVGEARRNLAAKASAQSVAILEALLGRISVHPMHAESRAELDWLDAKDRPVLLAAMAAQCDVLLTGDKRHFGQAYGHSYDGVLVCSAAQLFALLRQRKGT